MDLYSPCFRPTIGAVSRTAISLSNHGVTWHHDFQLHTPSANAFHNRDRTALWTLDTDKSVLVLDRHILSSTTIAEDCNHLRFLFFHRICLLVLVSRMAPLKNKSTENGAIFEALCLIL